MSDGVFISDRPQLAIARQTVSFASLGLNDPTLTRIIYEVGNPYLSYVPTDEFNPISGITEGKSYLLYLNAFFDGSPALANAVLTNLIPQTTTNVFADERVVFLCTSSVSFATAGITTSNTRLITLVSEGYFTSYDPNDSINGIDGFVEGELYDIDPITDIDLHLYGVTKIRYSDEVLYLDSLEDVVITNSLPDATLPLAEDETLVRNPITGIWENEPVRVKFVDDEASRPATGIENIVYVAKAEKTSWYWDGSAYQQIGGGTGGTPTLEQVVNAGQTATKAIKISSSGYIGSSNFAGIELSNTIASVAYNLVTNNAGEFAIRNGALGFNQLLLEPGGGVSMGDLNDGTGVPKMVYTTDGVLSVGAAPSGGTSYTDAQAKAANPQSKTMTIGGPTGTDIITIFYTDVAITVTKLNDQVQGTGGGLGVTYQINHATTRNSGTPNTLLSAARFINTQAGSFTTTFNDATIPAGSWVWYVASSTGGVPSEISITLTYTID
jgi:hypothetical protein